jgi:hypothetical protein
MQTSRSRVRVVNNTLWFPDGHSALRRQKRVAASARRGLLCVSAPGRLFTVVAKQLSHGACFHRPGVCFAMKAKTQLNLEIWPLTPQRWPALTDLFGPLGACHGCWCMYGRIGAAYRKRGREQNKAAFREIVKRGPPPGLLAFDGDLAVGWCQLTPRDAVPHLDHLWRLKRVDDVSVWCMSVLLRSHRLPPTRS